MSLQPSQPFLHPPVTTQPRERLPATTRLLAPAFLLTAGLAACAGSPQGPPEAAPAVAAGADETIGLDNLNAVLWVQTAVEYRATALQAYALGRRALDEALADPTWTALLEQQGDYAELPPAVILDIDETVLDNSPYEARLLLDRATYDESSWAAWVEQRAAEAVPGAREFVVYAAARGVAVFYVSNRRAPLEAATRDNLAAEGFPLDDTIDTVLLRGEIPAWEASDKTPRFRHIAADHRVLLMFGDNMGDFTAASGGDVAERAAFATEHVEYWGTRWITLANPTYGSFISAVLGEGGPTSWEVAVQRKKQALDPRRPGG